MAERQFYTALVLLSFAVFTSAIADEPKKDEEFKPSREEQAILDLVNKEREKGKLPPLQANEKLFKAARGHSANMAKQERMEHNLDGLEPADRVKAEGYASRFVGENVAFGLRTPAEVMKVWMNSEGHRKNILRKEYTEIGIGIARSKRGVPYYTQVFARPR
jgi:uncharacterized protein YkwD